MTKQTAYEQIRLARIRLTSVLEALQTNTVAEALLLLTMLFVVGVAAAHLGVPTAICVLPTGLFILLLIATFGVTVLDEMHQAREIENE